MIINKDVMRSRNEQSVLQTIINNGPISRNEISKLLGLNKMSVSEIVGAFIDKKIVTSLGEDQTTSTSGRKPEIVAFNSSYGYVINFSISGNSLEMLVTKLDGRTLEHSLQKITGFSISDIVELMKNQIDQLPKLNTENGLLAISIAIFGVVYNEKIISSPFINFEGFDIAGYFKNEYDVPVILENEANLSAIFEQDFSKQELQNIISISIHEGIGAGIILNTQLYTGNYGQAGEIGRIIVRNSDKNDSNLSSLPTFDQEWSHDAIISKAQQLKNDFNYDLDDLVTDFNNHDSQISKLIDDFCYQLTIVTIDLIASFDPQMIFFNSQLVERIPEILKIVQMKLSFVPLVPPLVMSKNVSLATLLGGASMAIHRALDMEKVRLIFHH
ncbi:ROK family transcriptional regulator [Lentilactobacillus sp. SPB1-3]|uniref:ROK family protein n=1 Tax=Lentilactobacillus terminaliae TaxID=3003483 RepID=A0ACD5DFV1_9LACO|nr:ROK family transcriptional regulator [Lentilactobacillus sp. SPB1-3]MCZ0976438.1 ROK family transcriptional regulator [Lentilactobacillus sp. SPB1-3]